MVTGDETACESVRKGDTIERGLRGLTVEVVLNELEGLKGL